MNLLAGTMNKFDLVAALGEGGEDLTKTKAEEVVDLVFSEMTNALVAGEIRNFITVDKSGGRCLF